MKKEVFIAQKNYWYSLLGVWIFLLMAFPAVAAPTNILSGGDFEGFIMAPVAPLGQPGNAWAVSSSAAGQTFGIGSYDIDGAGLLGASNVFFARAGDSDGGVITLSQTVSLLEGVSYSFAANIASTTAASNADGGTLTASIGSTLLTSHEFGTVFSGSPEYGALSGTFTPTTGGNYLLSIDIERLYQVSSVSPTVYLDNIELSYDTVPVSAVPAPSAFVLGGVGMLFVQWLRLGRNGKEAVH